jgi:hypothetical protein
MRHLRKLFCSFLALLIFAVTGPWQVLAQPAASTIVGTVINAQLKPVPEVKIVIKDPSGKALRATLTDEDGRYILKDVNAGKYQLTLDPLKKPFQGETVLANLGSQGLTVNWMLAAAVAPIATAQPGTVAAGGFMGIGDAWTVVLINAVGGGLGTGIAWAVGGFDKKTGRRVVSPTS